MTDKGQGPSKPPRGPKAAQSPPRKGKNEPGAWFRSSAWVELDMSETQWQNLVIQYSLHTGWRHYHTHDSRRSAAGFPDLVLVRNRRLIFAELKKKGGQVSKEQRQWLDMLGQTTAECHLWRPEDWSDVQKILR